MDQDRAGWVDGYLDVLPVLNGLIGRQLSHQPVAGPMPVSPAVRAR